MTKADFDIKLSDLHWIKSIDDPTDLCAHGCVYVRIGTEVIAEKGTLNVTVSSTALYLMRTLKENYTEGDYASQLLPCCGHLMIADNEKDLVDICGCPNGIDWRIIHTDGNKVKHISESGQEAIIDKEDYKKLVLDFVDQVEQFYKNSKTKEIPTDDSDRKGYLTFWKEWRNLRDEWK
jgi:hypothetical protein